jgi:hypothetical protein
MSRSCYSKDWIYLLPRCQPIFLLSLPGKHRVTRSWIGMSFSIGRSDSFIGSWRMEKKISDIEIYWRGFFSWQPLAERTMAARKMSALRSNQAILLEATFCRKEYGLRPWRPLLDLLIELKNLYRLDRTFLGAWTYLDRFARDNVTG